MQENTQQATISAGVFKTEEQLILFTGQSKATDLKKLGIPNWIISNCKVKM
jgi:hypothetical protein